jgi:hypothetical protein
MDAPISLVSRSADGWVLLASGSLVTATVPIPVGEAANPHVVAVSVNRPHSES